MQRAASLRPVDGPTPAVIDLLADWLGADDPEPLQIETSGSTGQPKRVVLSRRAVLASAHAAHERLGGPGRWTLLLPQSYVAGVQVVVRSLLAGRAPDTALVPHAERSYVSVVPTQLHRMLADAEQRRLLTDYEAVLVGGASLDPRLRAEAEQAGVRLVSTYGSSETAGGCVYDGLPLDGVGVKIGADGLVRIAGPTLFDEYADDPGLSASVRDGDWFVTSDLGEIDLDGRLRVLGRADDVLNTGGVKVPGPLVAHRLRLHPAIKAAEVVGVPDAEWGQRLVAVVVAPEPPSLDDVRDWVGEAHPREWAPRQVVVVDAIPLLPTGKTDRAGLVSLVELVPGR